MTRPREHPHREEHPDVSSTPRPWEQVSMLRGARAAGPPLRPSAEPVTVQRRASTGVIMVAGQKIALGPIHTAAMVTVHVAHDTMTIDLGGQGTRTIRRTTTQAIRSIKPTGPAGPPMFPRPSGKHLLGLIRQSSGGPDA